MRPVACVIGHTAAIGATAALSVTTRFGERVEDCWLESAAPASSERQQRASNTPRPSWNAKRRTNPGHDRAGRPNRRKPYTERRDHEIGFSCRCHRAACRPIDQTPRQAGAQTDGQNQCADEPLYAHGFRV
jgi:hypothetical protein